VEREKLLALPGPGGGWVLGCAVASGYKCFFNWGDSKSCTKEQIKRNVAFSMQMFLWANWKTTQRRKVSNTGDP